MAQATSEHTVKSYDQELSDLNALVMRMGGLVQEQLERAMATGQAILVCRSPEEAMRLQLSYMQATLVSGFERVGLMTRWSQDRMREVLPARPR